MSGRLRFTLLAAAACLASAPSTRAQEIPEFNKLRTSTSPAFILLGITPAEVDRPSVPASFAASVLQQTEMFTSGLPKAFAAELAPYWMVPHPGLTLTKYRHSGAASLYRNVTISLATTDSSGPGVGAPAGNTSFRRLGFGVRTTLVPGDSGPPPPCINEVNAAATALSGVIGARVARAIASVTLSAQDAIAIEAFKTSIYPAALASLPLAQRKALTELVQSCTKDLSVRRGFSMDIAGGMAARFPSGTVDSGRVSTAGVWLTPALLGESFSHIVVVRGRWDDLDTDSSSTALDLGARSIYAWDRFASSVELVNRAERRRGATSDFVRASVIFDVRLVGDYWVNLSFGKDFDARKRQSLIALIGFQWQLGDRSVRPDV